MPEPVQPARLIAAATQAPSPDRCTGRRSRSRCNGFRGQRLRRTRVWVHLPELAGGVGDHSLGSRSPVASISESGTQLRAGRRRPGVVGPEIMAPVARSRALVDDDEGPACRHPGPASADRHATPKPGFSSGARGTRRTSTSRPARHPRWPTSRRSSMSDRRPAAPLAPRRRPGRASARARWEMTRVARPPVLRAAAPCSHPSRPPTCSDPVACSDEDPGSGHQLLHRRQLVVAQVGSGTGERLDDAVRSTVWRCVERHRDHLGAAPTHLCSTAPLCRAEHRRGLWRWRDASSQLQRMVGATSGEGRAGSSPEIFYDSSCRRLPSGFGRISPTTGRRPLPDGDHRAISATFAAIWGVFGFAWFALGLRHRRLVVPGSSS